ncbi:MAG: hypothetical protein U1D70_14135 [Methylobacter sp.]|nr:hypothetical protein [Methylobacter sp.]MDZ4220144.1 hypothetical protein [Methylobacter sp.]
MTFSDRRRLFALIKLLLINSSIPFLLGAVFSMMINTYTLTDIFKKLDDSGFSICIANMPD